MLLHHLNALGRPTSWSRLEDGGTTLPHNIELEQALLGAILVNNAALDAVSGFLKPGHFYDRIHGEIFDCLSRLIAAGRPATPVTLKGFFENAEPIDHEMTVPMYLGTLAINATTTANARDYGRAVYDYAVRRELMGIASDLMAGATDQNVETPSLIEKAEGSLYAACETGRHGDGFHTFAEAAEQALAMAEAAHARGGGLSGLATGLIDLDNRMGGLQPSDLIILAGRPSMGKTALATNIAYRIAKRHTVSGNEVTDGGIVGFFSLEMSAEQLATRVLAEQSGISSELIRRGRLSPEQMDRYRETVAEMRRIPLYIEQTGGLSISQLAARARRLKRQKGLGLLIVDYLQMLSGSGRSDNRVQEITQITTGLKALAKELNVPIIALSQLSRQVETREDKRPQLSDLRESGSIEQDADVVMFVFREEYYVERRKPADTNFAEIEKWKDEMAAVAGKAEVLIGKQRHGPTGTVNLAFQASLTRFDNLAHEDAPPAQAPRRASPGKPEGWSPPSHVVEQDKPLSISERAIAASRRPS